MIADSFSIRRADRLERRSLLRQFLSRSVQDNAEIFVAAEPDHPKPFGAAAIWFMPNRHFPEKANCILQVAESHRGRGIGRTLVESIAAAAREAGAKQLRTSPVEEGSAGFRFLESCGFEFGAPTITWEVPLEEFANLLNRLYDRLQKSGRIPAGAQVLPLSEVSAEEVCKLVIDNLGFPSEHVAERLRGSEHGFSRSGSRVALLDDRLVGALLLTYQKVVTTIEATAVLPEHRNSWANIALRYSAVKEGLADGVERIRFTANSEAHPDTFNHATRMNARVLKTIRQPTLDLSG